VICACRLQTIVLAIHIVNASYAKTTCTIKITFCTILAKLNISNNVTGIYKQQLLATTNLATPKLAKELLLTIAVASIKKKT